MKTIFSIIIFAVLVVSGHAQTRNVLVGTSGAVVQPTNFWSADAINARSGLGLGSAATNPASAFQPSSLVLSNLSLGNGAGITNIPASAISSNLAISNIAGLQSALDAKLGTNASSSFQPSSLSLSNLASSNGGSLTNITAANIVGVIPSSNIPSVAFTNISGTLTIAQGGTSATNAANARQNLGSTIVGDAVFVATNAEAARSAIGALAVNGNAVSLTNFPSLLLRTNGDGSGITNISGANIIGSVASASNITGSIAISNVSNLQAALDGKLSTNPTLFIANISNLQTTLDGKLGTNPMLQISNIAALQTALDGKLSGTFPIAISNVSGLQTSLDSKLGTNPTLSIANISGLQTNLDSKLSITGNAANLTNFPASLLRTTGDASSLTNFPTLNQNTVGTASNVTGIVAVANGGTGTNNAIGARQNLGLVWSGLTNTTAETFRTALGLGSLSTLSVISISNVNNLQSSLDQKLEYNGNAINLTNFPSSLLRATGDASGLTNFPILNQNTTGTASNVTGIVSITNGGTGANNAITARQNLNLTWTGITNSTAENFRSALGLGSLSTLSAVAISNVTGLQSELNLKLASNGNAVNLTNFPSDLLRVNGNAAALTNFPVSILRTTGDASGLTNFPTLNQNTTGTASNVTGVVAITNGGTGANTASGARTELGLGTAATNSATAFQPSSSILSNVASSGVFVGLTNLGVGGNLGFSSTPYVLGSTNSTLPNNAVSALDAAGVRFVSGLTLPALTNADNSSFRVAIGLGTAATNASSAFQPASTILSNLASNNGSSLTNISVNNVAGALATNGNGFNLTNLNASNLSGTIPVARGGTGASNASTARANLGLGWPALINTNVSTSLLGFTTNGQVVADTGTNVLTFTNSVAFEGGNVSTYASGFTAYGVNLNLEEGRIQVNNIADDVINWSDGLKIVFGLPADFATTNAVAETRTNLGLGGTWLTNANVTDFRSSIGLPLAALTNTNASGFRSAIGLAGTWVTNANANDIFGTGTSPVLANTNGEVVLPTNFWQSAPVSTLVQNFTNISANTTNAATNARNLYVYSFSSSHPSGITNTITLPTNTSVFNGDVVTVVHAGTTSGVTAVRPLGGTNIIQFNNLDESVRFIYKGTNWELLPSFAFTDPIYFSGNNASANATASRVNMGIPWSGLTNTNAIQFRSSLEFSTNLTSLWTATNAVNARAAIGAGNVSQNDTVTFNSIIIPDGEQILADGEVAMVGDFRFNNAIMFNDPSNTRTNLGLGFSALTNTNAAGFQRDIFTTNTTPTNTANINSVPFHTVVAWMQVSIVTNNVTNSYRIPLFQ